jgi:ArsR family transcriptional regulator
MPVATAPSIDLVFRAFSDRTRLRLLSLLRAHGGEVCVCDLIRVLGLPQAKVSRHLAYLRKAGLVTVRKEGAWRHYTLAGAGSAFHRKLLECLTCCFAEVPELRRDAKALGTGCGTEGDCC